MSAIKLTLEQRREAEKVVERMQDDADGVAFELVLHRDQATALRAENAALRGALSKIKDDPCNWERVHDIASAALRADAAKERAT